MTIKVTNRMVQLIYERIDFHDHGDAGIREGLQDVFAELEQTHEIKPRCGNQLMPGVACRDSSPDASHVSHWGYMPNGREVSWS